MTIVNNISYTFLNTIFCYYSVIITTTILLGVSLFIQVRF